MIGTSSPIKGMSSVFIKRDIKTAITSPSIIPKVANKISIRLLDRRYPSLFFKKLCACGSVQPNNKKTNSTDRKSTRLNSSHVSISYAVFCLKKKKEEEREKLAVTVGANPEDAIFFTVGKTSDSRS